jgi:uridine phosphorylase
MTSVWPDRSELPDANEPGRAECRAMRCLPGEVAPNVLVPGDPARAARIANEWLEDARPVMVQREFHTYTGHYQGTPVSVVSTGIGGPGAAMVIQDLARLGCRNVIRVGTAGSVNEDVNPGDNVIGIGAVRDEGLSHKFLPAKYPAVADLDVTNALRSASAQQNAAIHVGVVHTSDAFRAPSLPAEIETAMYAGVLCFEMEAATVLTIARLEKLRAGCIFSIDGFVANVSAGNTTPDVNARNQGIKDAIKTALDAIVLLES